MTTDEDRLHEERLRTFDRLEKVIEQFMSQFGRPDFEGGRLGDFDVIGDYWGYPQVKVGIHDLALLRPDIVKGLQRIIADFPEWEIVYTVAVRGHYGDWPDMGLYIRAQEIIDTLQRQYFPKEFQTIRYEGSRRAAEPGSKKKPA
ncbi:MAG: hypothetical protein WDO17_22710 [Alphaproteobacteria bacterium]